MGLGRVHLSSCRTFKVYCLALALGGVALVLYCYKQWGFAWGVLEHGWLVAGVPMAQVTSRRTFKVYWLNK
jgi:hypothetical protein